jgi:HK97 family phage portal protein
MPKLWPFSKSEEIKAEAYYENSTIPIGYGKEYFEDNSFNVKEFANEAMNSDSIVYACLRELGTAAAEPSYRVLLPTSDQPIQAPDTNPISRLLERPNENQDFYQFIDELVINLYVAGNAYLYKTRNGGGKVVGMRLLRPDRVSIKVLSSDGSLAYQYELDGVRYRLNPEDVSQLKFPSMTSDLYGLSPLQPIASVINLDLAQIQYAKFFFQNSGTPSGLLKVKRRLQTPEDAERIRSRWRSTFGGGNMHKLAVLDEDATYERLGESISNMAFPELRDTTESRICMAFGIPPILIGSVVGLDRATYSNYREARQSFFYETMIPLANRIVRFLNHCISYEFPTAGYIEADFNDVAALTEDQNSLTERTTKQWDSGLISLNEAREALGLDPLNGGEIRRMPLGVIELDADQVVPTPLQMAQPTQQLDIGPLAALKESEPPDLMPNPYKPNNNADVLEDMARQNKVMMDMRVEEVESLEPKLDRFFKSMVNRTDGVLGRYLERDSNTLVIKLPISLQASGLAGELLPDGATQDLANILRPSYARMIKKTFKQMNEGRSLTESSRVGPLKFDPNSMEVQRVLSKPSASAREIVSFTQRKLRNAIVTAQERGYTTAQLANGVADDGFVGVRQLSRETYSNRTKTIARTEVAKAQNAASITYAKEQGMDYVRAFDPDGDENDTYIPAGDPYGRTCAERHMQIYAVGDAYDIEDHPNGTLQWFPVESNKGQTIVEIKDNEIISVGGISGN